MIQLSRRHTHHRDARAPIRRLGRALVGMNEEEETDMLDEAPDTAELLEPEALEAIAAEEAAESGAEDETADAGEDASESGEDESEEEKSE